MAIHQIGRLVHARAGARYPLILLIAVVAVAAVWIALADNLSTAWASRSAPIFPTSGLPASSYSKANPGHRTIALQHAAERNAFGGRDVPFFGWHYPPLF